MTRLLLDPGQQRMPEMLELVLEDAVRLAEAGDTGAARERLEQARAPARTVGYL